MVVIVVVVVVVVVGMGMGIAAVSRCGVRIGMSGGRVG